MVDCKEKLQRVDLRCDRAIIRESKHTAACVAANQMTFETLDADILALIDAVSLPLTGDDWDAATEELSFTAHRHAVRATKPADNRDNDRAEYQDCILEALND